jgi:hypothetical protein
LRSLVFGWSNPVHPVQRTKALVAWECRLARTLGKVVISRPTIQANIGATVSPTVFLSGGLDDSRNCETGIISFPDGKAMSGLAAQDEKAYRKYNFILGCASLGV